MKIINLKTLEEMEVQKEAVKIVMNILTEITPYFKDGMSTKEIDDFIKERILSYGGIPAFLNYNGFPNSSCISINEELVHGIPTSIKILKKGDIVTVDTGVFYKGFYSDMAKTFIVEDTTLANKYLLQTTFESLIEGMNKAINGNTVGDISFAIQSYAESKGFQASAQFTGHGIGKELHEPPNVPCYGIPHDGIKLTEGMVLCIEPLILTNTNSVNILKDKWTAVSDNGLSTCHWEGICFLYKDRTDSFYVK